MATARSTCCFSAPAIPPVRSWRRRSSTARAGAISAAIPPAASRKGRSSVHARSAAQPEFRRAAPALEVLGRIYRGGRPAARFRFHRLRQRRRRGLSGVARPADDRALGRSRSGRRDRQRSQVRLAFADTSGCCPHRALRQLAAALARQAHAAAPTQNSIGASTDSGSVIGRRLIAEALGTAFSSPPSSAPASWRRGLPAVTAPSRSFAIPYRPALSWWCSSPIFAPVSGAHFNPAVTLAFAPRATGRGGRRRPTSWRNRRRHLRHIVAHLMFDLAPLAIGTTARSGPRNGSPRRSRRSRSAGDLRRRQESPQPCLGGRADITSTYWFTSSTFFANPAVTLARGFTTTFAGIAINHVPGFIAAQLVGAAIATAVAMMLWRGA